MDTLYAFKCKRFRNTRQHSNISNTIVELFLKHPVYVKMALKESSPCDAIGFTRPNKCSMLSCVCMHYLDQHYSEMTNMPN
jgi:hypothetical protein